jgi:MFS family permease
MVQAVGGIAVLLGRIAGGYALDRLGTRAIAVFMTMLIAVAIYGYAAATTLGMVLVSAILLGLATGGEGDVLPFMAVKYFGPRAFGKIYGMLGGMFSAGTALGPVTYAGLAALSGSPSTPLLVFSAMTAVSAFAFIGVGRRPPP